MLQVLEAVDLDGNGSIDRVELGFMLERWYYEWKALEGDLQNYSTVSQVFESLIGVVYWIVLVLVVLVIAGVSLGDLFVPLGAILVATSFAVASSTRMLVDSLLFVLGFRAVDVGEKVKYSHHHRQLWSLPRCC